MNGGAVVDAKMAVFLLVESLARRLDLNRRLVVHNDREEADAAVFVERRRRTVGCLMHMANRGGGA
jgi:hypothetical protein